MSLRINSSKPQQTNLKTIDFRLKYKTQKCRYWFDTGYCIYGQECAFAHDSIEIRDKKQLNTNYKTKICHNYAKNGFCKYGDRCQFVHQTSKKNLITTCLTRSNSIESQSQSTTSSQSKNQMKSKNKLQNKKQKKHSLQLQMLTQFGMNSFEVFCSNFKQSFMPKFVSKQQENQFLNLSYTNIEEGLDCFLPKKRLYSL